MNFKITKKKCQQGINGVCEGCGGKLEPIETVDNAGDPTYWCGCKHCSCFRSGVDRIHFEIARQLVLENTMIPYPNISGKNGTPEAKEYWLDSQTAGLSHDIARIHRMINEKAGMPNYETKLGRAEKIPLESNSIDLVVNQESLHEWEDPKKGFSEISRVLKPGGRMILKDLNKNCPRWKLRFFSLLISITAGRQSAKDHIGSYKNAFTFEEVVDLSRDAGFDEIDGEGEGLELFVRARKSI